MLTRAALYRSRTAAEKANLYYGDVEVVVLDEADTMFDRGFGPEVKAILAAVRSKAEPARCVLVSATMTKAVRKLVGLCCCRCCCCRCGRRRRLQWEGSATATPRSRTPSTCRYNLSLPFQHSILMFDF